MSSALLRRFSTLKIAGSAEKVIGLSEFLKDPAQKLPEPVRVLGNGSNILMDDRGLKGSVILVREDSVPSPELIENHADYARIQLGAGTFGPALARWTSRQGLSGCEYLIGVPGTLGGAVVQNAGANEQEMSMILERVKVFDFSVREFRLIEAKDCHLEYRKSDFQELKIPKIITELFLKLPKADAAECEQRLELNLSYRKSKTPWTKATLGSTWTRLKDAEGNWLFPGRLIEEAGLKGFKIGPMQISEVHANYMINTGDGKFSQAMALMEAVEKRVYEHSGIHLHREIQVWTDAPGP